MLRRKTVLRLNPYLFARVRELAKDHDLVGPDGTPKYAETVRVLLINQVLHDYPQPVRVATAVLSNTTVALSALLADLTHKLNADLENFAARAAGIPEDDLSELRNLQKQPKKERIRGSPVVHLTFDHWLYRILKHAVSQAGESRSPGFRTNHAYVLNALLRAAVDDTNAHEMLHEYSRASRKVQQAVRRAVERERRVLRLTLANA